VCFSTQAGPLPLDGAQTIEIADKDSHWGVPIGTDWDPSLTRLFTAISFLERREDVDPHRIGVWGISYSGGHALLVAAIDPRVKIIVSQIPGDPWL
jgi:dienelactone hydrolase